MEEEEDAVEVEEKETRGEKVEEVEGEVEGEVEE